MVVDVCVCIYDMRFYLFPPKVRGINKTPIIVGNTMGLFNNNDKLGVS